MKAEDLTPFAELLDATCRMLSRGSYAPNDLATGMFFRALARYSFDDVRAAIDAHLADPERGRFVPAPADLIAQLERSQLDDGRPGPEEAFTGVLPAFNPDDSVVWTEEQAHAWGVCRMLCSEVSQRLAFKEAYIAAVAKARAERRPVVWLLAEGNDHGRRVEAVKQARMRGINLDHHRADDLVELPAPTAPVALLAAPAGPAGESHAAIEGKAHLSALILRMRKPAPELVSTDAAAREETLRLQQLQLERVARYGLVHRAYDPGPLPMPMRDQTDDVSGPAAA